MVFIFSSKMSKKWEGFPIRIMFDFLQGSVIF